MFSHFCTADQCTGNVLGNAYISMGETTPQTVPSHSGCDLDNLICDFLGPPMSPPQKACRLDCRSDAAFSLYFTMNCHMSPRQIAIPPGGYGPQSSTSLIKRTTPAPQMANTKPFLITSATFAGYVVVTN